jgi:hypothetical protein
MVEAERTPCASGGRKSRKKAARSKRAREDADHVADACWRGLPPSM